jgi:O-antigen ligase
MHDSSRGRALRAGLTLAAAGLLYLFYIKYVPLVIPFQIVLVPVLLACFALTAVRLEWGALFFVFSFPLINNLPYLFGIFDTTPHAPTALVLFLAFFLGWLAGRVRQAPAPGPGHPIFRPLALFLAVASVSGVITFLRYSNFFPFRSGAIYELIVNVNGVRAGGALMSDIFSLLNYLTGPVFLVIILPLLPGARFVRRVLVALSSSALLALIFSAVQEFHSLSLGNYPFFIRLNQINATFKDPNSFGAFVSSFIPLALGAALSFRRGLRWFSLFLVALALVMFPAIGSRSPLGALVVALVMFAILGVARLEMPPGKKLIRAAAFLGIAAALIAGLFAVRSQSILAKRLGTSLGVFSETTSPNAFFNKRLTFWQAAVSMASDYPLTGVGLGAYIIELPNYLRSLGVPMKATDSALNYPLQVIAVLGLVGLLLLVWAVVEILKQLARSWRSCPPERRYLLAGVISGLGAFAVNLMFQTFIGSFEIKVMLWLLIALAFALGGEGARPLRTRKPGRHPALVVLTLGLGFATLHGWNSTHSLSLERRTADLGIRQEFGLDRIEKTPEGREFRWSQRRAALTVAMTKATLEIPLLASHPDVRENPVQVRVYRVVGFFRGKELLGGVTLRDSDWTTGRFSLPGEAGHDIIVLLEVSRTWNPLKTLGVPDPRNLGVAVGKINS